MIGELLRVPAQAVQRHIHRAFSEAGYAGLRPAHMNILIHVDHPPGGTRITELAERAMMTKQSMGQLVADMESRGLVERVADPTDARAKIVRLTARGWAMHEAAGEIGKGLEADWAARIGDQKFAHLRQLLKELIASLDAGHHPLSPSRLPREGGVSPHRGKGPSLSPIAMGEVGSGAEEGET